MGIVRLFVRKKDEYDIHAKKTAADIKNVLGIDAEDVKVFLRYDIEGMADNEVEAAVKTVFSEPPVDIVYVGSLPPLSEYRLLGVEYLPGQYDQRADSAAQCVQLLTLGARPEIRTATIYAVKGVSSSDMERIEKYLINPVESRACSFEMPDTLKMTLTLPEPPAVLDGFINFKKNEINDYHAKMGFAMSKEDLEFVRAHFEKEGRDPYEIELKVIDTYWSDHCRHTTFLTKLDSVKIKSDIPKLSEAYDKYRTLFADMYAGRDDKYPCLMDMATIGAKSLKKAGLLPDLDESEEINACSIKVKADIAGNEEDWLVMFKNETHNHPTEIEPFGGAATCLGGAIRDPLSGRSYVYHAMRITGAADINAPLDKTMKGKLPQRVITRTAAAGFSSYGNQIGLATGMVKELYHPGFAAKRLETGFVVGAAPADNVVRTVPEKGDVVLLIGGETGRDGCGGATGSSKAHNLDSIDTCGAEVQKGNPLTERKIQRLFRNPSVTRLIKRCNDFGAGGVSVAIGELSRGLDINLDSVPKKYFGLSATELAISESQERMAVVIDKKDTEKMIALCAEENLSATEVAVITDTERMRMIHNGEVVVDLKREFLDTNGVTQTAKAVVKESQVKYFSTLSKAAENAFEKGEYDKALLERLSDYNVCSQKGLSEMFDSTIGAGTVLMPFGGKLQTTPAMAMAALLPAEGARTATVAAYGCIPELLTQSPFTGAVYSVLLSVIKVVLSGAPFESVRLTFQEYFPRLGADAERWGKPVSALLGALYAQLELQLGSIGGKDSMSGTFEKLDVPPTLISFALGIADASKIIDNTLKRDGQKVYRLKLRRDATDVPDLSYAAELLKHLSALIDSGEIDYAAVVEEGGAAAEIAKSCFGQNLGFAFAGAEADYFTPAPGDILISVSDPMLVESYSPELIGFATDTGVFHIGSTLKSLSIDEYIVSGGVQVSAKDAYEAFSGTFAGVYPMTADAVGQAEKVTFENKNITFAKTKTAKPRVFIPVFPGTNCEYDTARAFKAAGAEVSTFVVKNRTKEDIATSVKEMARLIKNSQIIMFPGGFSGGDEPDGSGKFIATTFRSEELKDAVHDLLYTRDGLALGICNGFQALIKLGLLPYGEIKELDATSPTLTFNNISRHVSTIVKTRVASNLSPWLTGAKLGGEYNVAVSHGEGKFIASEAQIAEFVKNGQIATQYVDLSGEPTMISPFNPNGSFFAIEGITSADGRVFGKMGHSERVGENLMKNIPGEWDMKVFESGVKYFK